MPCFPTKANMYRHFKLKGDNDTFPINSTDYNKYFTLSFSFSLRWLALPKWLKRCMWQWSSPTPLSSVWKMCMCVLKGLGSCQLILNSTGKPNYSFLTELQIASLISEYDSYSFTSFYLGFLLKVFCFLYLINDQINKKRKHLLNYVWNINKRLWTKQVNTQKHPLFLQ